MALLPHHYLDQFFYSDVKMVLNLILTQDDVIDNAMT